LTAAINLVGRIKEFQMAGCGPASDRQPRKRRLGFIAGLNRPVGNAAGVEKID
jgi:hypothetical protein